MSILVGILILVGFFSLVIWASLFFGIFPGFASTPSEEDAEMVGQLKPFAMYFLVIGLLSLAATALMIYFRF